MDRFSNTSISTIVALLRREQNLKALAQNLGVNYVYLNQIKNGKRKNPGLSVLGPLCRHYGFSIEDLHAIHDIKPSDSFTVALWGCVQAGPATDPGESVNEHEDVERVHLDMATWRWLFPSVSPDGLHALRINGDSMKPRFCDRDLIFVRRSSDVSAVQDGDPVVLYISGEGYTFKIWRNGVLESINREAFPPRVCPKGARLWGIFACCTHTGC